MKTIPNSPSAHTDLIDTLLEIAEHFILAPEIRIEDDRFYPIFLREYLSLHWY